MTVKEYIEKSEYAGTVFAYIECVTKEGIDDEHLRGLDIENDEYEDNKKQVDELIEQATYCSIADYPILTEKDTWRYFEDRYWRYYGDDGEYIKLIEQKPKWMEDPWGKFHRLVERTIDAFNKKTNGNDALYECNGYYFMIDAG